MSDTINAAFCDLSEISCHWGLRSSLFNSAGDCHVPNASVTVCSCLRASEMYLNKRAQASPVGDMHQEDFWQCWPPVSPLEKQQTCEHTLGWHRALPKRVKPNRIYITCDIHMMVQNWFVMPDLGRSITAATKAGMALVVVSLWADSPCGHMMAAAALTCVAVAEAWG